MERLHTIKPKYDWVKIIKQDIIKHKYGLKGEIWWHTDRVPEIQRLVALNLDNNKRILGLFKIEKL